MQNGYGGEGTQPCRVATIRAVLRHLQASVPPLRNHTGYAPTAKDVLNAVCKPDPVNSRQVIIAVVYTDRIAEGRYGAAVDNDYDVDVGGDPTPVELAIVDRRRGTVVASGDSHIESMSPNPEIDDSSVRLDTARYDLAHGVRAFGVDASDGYSPNCGDGIIGPSRSLYVREGSRIRPVLRNLTLTHDWVMQQGSPDRCHQDRPDLPDVVEHSSITIGVAETLAHGWHDLWVTKVFWINDEEPGGHCRVKLHYDGRRYSTGAVDNSTSCDAVEEKVVKDATRRFHIKAR